jgi:N-methylhydantoinase A
MSRGEHRKSTWVLAVDTGGTFTDLLLLRGSEIHALKVPSTPKDPAIAVLNGIRELFGVDHPSYRLIIGSTVATNTLLERDGARVFLITNQGFEDVIEIGRQNRPQLYALSGHRLPPLVDREDRIGVEGRIGASGEELSPLDLAELGALRGRLAGAEAVAVVLLHSYANSAHELTVEEYLADLGVPVSISCRVLPEFREFERTSTTVANAYVGPRVRRYLSRLSRDCPDAAIRVMGSNGGALSLQQSLDEPVHTVLSGPAGGVVGAAHWARSAGLEKILSFDMGGTSTDVSLVSHGFLQTREGEVAGIPIAIPLLEIHTVGAGGGSIAQLDAGGALRVGPRSAGAEPGPICYAKGGTELTVTDAHVWLGRLPPQGLLGGSAPLRRDLLEPHFQRVAESAGITAEELAEGIVDIADTAMESALRVISVERGVDPSDFHLVAFGGAAGLHAATLADRLGLEGAIVPPDPGLLSSFGMLVAPVSRDRARTMLLSSVDREAPIILRRIFTELEEEARQEMLEDGADPEQLRVERRIDARYEGQSYELSVETEDWVESFHRAHEVRYGYRRPIPIEAVTLRVRVEAPGVAVRVEQEASTSISAHDETATTRAWVEEAWMEVPVRPRSHLAVGDTVRGPAVVVEYSSTTWCPPGWQVERDDLGILRLLRDVDARDREA